jgi:hypothetical protein
MWPTRRATAGSSQWCNVNKFGDHFEELRHRASEEHGASAKQAVGEATSNYLNQPEVAPLTYAAFPNVKIVALLRNPIDRAYSGYFQHIKHQSSASFTEALTLEMELIKECSNLYPNFADDAERWYTECVYPGLIEKTLRATMEPGGMWEHHPEFAATPRQCNPAYVQWRSHITRGMYYFQLKQWLRFFPKNQILVIKSEDYFKNPDEAINQMGNMLNVSVKKLPKLTWEKELQRRQRRGGVGDLPVEPISNRNGFDDSNHTSDTKTMGNDSWYGGANKTDGRSGHDNRKRRGKREGSFGGQNSKSVGEMPKETRVALERLYAPYNTMLYELLHNELAVQFSPWLPMESETLV